MNIDKYYQIYKRDNELKKIIDLYAQYSERYELIKTVQGVIEACTVIQPKAWDSIKNFVVSEIIIKNLMLGTDADNFIVNILDELKKPIKSGVAGKVSVNKDDIVTVKYKDFSISLAKSVYENWRKLTDDNHIAAELMCFNFILSENRRINFDIGNDVQKILTELKKKGYKKIYEISAGFFRSGAPFVKDNLELRTFHPELDGATGNVFNNKFEDKSIILINLHGLRLLQYLILSNIVDPLLKEKDIVVIYNHFSQKIMNLLTFTNHFEIHKTKQGIMNYSLDEHQSYTPGATQEIAIITSNEALHKELNKIICQDDKCE